MKLKVIASACPERTKGRPCCLHEVEHGSEDKLTARLCCWCRGGTITRDERHGPYRWRKESDHPAMGARVRR